MESHEDRVAATEQIEGMLAAGAADELRAIPGVVHVSVGLKERGGVTADELSVRVYVEAKTPLDRVPLGQRIPETIDGVPTDVNVVREVTFSADNGRYRPLKGGYRISTNIIGMNAAQTKALVSAGTLGCVATYVPDGSPVLLTNWHVLSKFTGDVDDYVFQPGLTTVPSTNINDIPKRPTDRTDSIGRILDLQVTDKVDGAIARLDVSSCCRCCGLDFRDEIDGISQGGHPPSNVITGLARPVAGDLVYKRGMMTGRTAGRVVDPNYASFTIVRDGVSYTFTGQIEIECTDPTLAFSEEGDSGSLILDDSNQAVGLLFAGDNQAPPDSRSYANHIADVCSLLNITINLTTGSTHSAGPLLDLPPGAGVETYAAVRERALRDPAGVWLLDVAEQHREEVVRLVTSRRPVTLAWHRSHGPAFMAVALTTLRADGETLPGPVDGVTGVDLLERMAASLTAHGGPELTDAIETHGPAVLDAVRGSATLSEALAKLSRVRQ